MRHLLYNWVSYFLLVMFLLGCSRNDDDVVQPGGGSSTEAENALTFIVVDGQGKILANVDASLCRTQAFCSDPVAEATSNAQGVVEFTGLDSGSYVLGLRADSLQGSLNVTVTSNVAVQLGSVVLTESGATLQSDAWTGTWSWRNVGDSLSEEWALVFAANGSLSSWRYSVANAEFTPGWVPPDSLWLRAGYTDLGLLKNWFAVFDTVSALQNAHIVRAPMTTNPTGMRWSSAFVLESMGDSLRFWGDVQIFTGTSTVLPGSSWSNTYASDDVRAFTLSESGNASVTVEDMVFSGTWSVNSYGKLTVEWDGGNSSFARYSVIRAGELFLMDLDDPGLFYKR